MQESIPHIIVWETALLDTPHNLLSNCTSGSGNTNVRLRQAILGEGPCVQEQGPRGTHVRPSKHQKKRKVELEIGQCSQLRGVFVLSALSQADTVNPLSTALFEP